MGFMGWVKRRHLKTRPVPFLPTLSLGEPRISKDGADGVRGKDTPRLGWGGPPPSHPIPSPHTPGLAGAGKGPSGWAPLPGWRREKVGHCCPPCPSQPSLFPLPVGVLPTSPRCSPCPSLVAQPVYFGLRPTPWDPGNVPERGTRRALEKTDRHGGLDGEVGWSFLTTGVVCGATAELLEPSVTALSVGGLWEREKERGKAVGNF